MITLPDIPVPAWSIYRHSKDRLIDTIRMNDTKYRNINFQSEGWYQKNGNTFLLVTDDVGWRMYFWRNLDPRPFLENLKDGTPLDLMKLLRKAIIGSKTIRIIGE